MVNMESYSKTTKSKSAAALLFLILIGVGFLLFGLVSITCGFVIDFHDDFEVADGGQALESLVSAQFDKSQYWLGFPFLVTAVLSLCSATFQKQRSLTTTTVIFFHICIILSLFAMILEGVDWVSWKNMDSLRRNWEDKDGYQCINSGHACICMDTINNANLTVSQITTCSNITSLSGLFGAIVASAIVGIFLSLAGIMVILKSISWKPRRYFVEYNLQPENPVPYKSYKNGGYANGGPARMAGQNRQAGDVTIY